MKADGIVSSLPDNKGNFSARIGIMQMHTNISDIDILGDDDTASAMKSKSNKYHPASSRNTELLNKSMNISPEINVIGMNVDEAVAVLDKYLDDAILAHLSKVRIIHGRGSGMLMKGIHNYLKKRPGIASYESADYNNGGIAVTEVML